MKKRLTLGILIILFLFINYKMNAYCKGGKDCYNAVIIEIPGQDDPEVKQGEDQWYYFTAPTSTTDEWVILRVIGLHERGTISYEILDEQLNVVKGNYTLSGSHLGEIVCRLDNTIEGTVDVFMPRLLREKMYYVRVSGTGKYSISLTTCSDDYSGGFRLATNLVVGTQTVGMLERDDDIDSFQFTVPNGYAYNVRVFATKKMNVRISDADNYTLDTNALKVMRDNSTSQYTISGYGTVRYFFLYGSGGTRYTIDVTIQPIPQDNSLGSWSQVGAYAGNNYIDVTTLKGAKVIIIVKKAKSRGKLILQKNKKKKYTCIQKKNTIRYYLNRRLRQGDIVIISISKKRFRDFHYKKKIKLH